jgi:hypothetical protein
MSEIIKLLGVLFIGVMLFTVYDCHRAEVGWKEAQAALEQGKKQEAAVDRLRGCCHAAEFSKRKAGEKDSTPADGVDYKQALDDMAKARKAAEDFGAEQWRIDRALEKGRESGAEFYEELHSRSR